MPIVVNGSPSSEDMINANMALTKMVMSSVIHDMLSRDTFNVFVRNNGPTEVRINADGQHQIFWNPYVGLKVVALDGSIGVQSAAQGLAHEIFHVAGDVFGRHDENGAMLLEGIATTQLGEPKRADYDSHQGDVLLKSPTVYTKDGKWVQMNLDGTETVISSYDPNQPPPNTSWTGNVGGGGGGGGTGGASGAAIIGGVSLTPSTDRGLIDKSYPTQPPGPPIITNPESMPDDLALNFLVLGTNSDVGTAQEEESVQGDLEIIITGQSSVSSPEFI